MLTDVCRPAGVGAGRKPPLWLKDGDVVEVGLEGVGSWYVRFLLHWLNRLQRYEY